MLLTECVEHRLDTTTPVFETDVLVVEALTLMQREGLASVPLLHEGKIISMVTLHDLLPVQHATKHLGELELEKAETIGLHEHLFDIFARIDSLPGELIAVSKEEGAYAGVLPKESLFECCSEIFHFGDECVTLELNVPSFNLKLSEVIAVLEKNDATVLSFGMYPATADSSGVVLVFRLQTHDLFRLVTNLAKYGYQIGYSSPFLREKDNEMREKAQELLYFMEM